MSPSSVPKLRTRPTGVRRTATSHPRTASPRPRDQGTVKVEALGGGPRAPRCEAVRLPLGVGLPWHTAPMPIRLNDLPVELANQLFVHPLAPGSIPVPGATDPRPAAMRHLPGVPRLPGRTPRPDSASPYVDMTVSAESSISTDMPLDLRGRGFGTHTAACGCWSRPPASASKLSPHPLSTD